MGANILASIEGLTGLLSFAVATGLLYGKFSRPRAHLYRSDNILISPYRKDQRGLMFRIASTRRHSMLVDNSVSVSMGINLEDQGHFSRRFYQLNLELDRINFLATSWTLVHPINEDSPLWGRTYEDLVAGRTEFIVLFRAMEETTSQITLERFSYFVDELVWGAKFDPMIGTTEEGQAMLNLNYISNWKHSPLPEEKAGPRAAAAIG
jgi:inward rectifier potassium channel